MIHYERSRREIRMSGAPGMDISQSAKLV